MTFLNESWIIWLYCLLLIAADIAFAARQQYNALVFVSLIFAPLILASLHIFNRYYKYSVDKKIVVNDTSVSLLDCATKGLNRLRFDEIKEVIVVQHSSFFSRAPWNTYGYVTLEANNNLKITITSFMVDPAIFILECIDGRVSKEKIVSKRRNYPIF